MDIQHEKQTKMADSQAVLVVQRSMADVILVNNENLGVLSNMELVNTDFVRTTEIGITRWFKRLPKLFQKKFLEIIHRAARPDVIGEIMGRTNRFAPWRLIDIGGTNMDGFLQRFQEEGKDEDAVDSVSLSHWARTALVQGSFEMIEKRRRVRILLLSFADLGLAERPSIGEMIESIQPKRLTRWSEENLYGWRLSLCPAEVGPHLRFQYRSQPEGENILIASEPIAVGDNNNVMFAVEHDYNENSSLQVMFVRPDQILPPNIKVAFVLRREIRLIKKDVVQELPAESSKVE